ncbi:hypothetical protein [Spirosoma linguale]|uniref:AB hydrolase-1 domain-containing protein n=1 Tax=Spirosoma linguale (strain ATCC 33905 / DSM 74 / LMG 10896 / Claus 1) TaxID=504472 RepID=D2QII7_SPILD|nr:conserved hypothetical protein [Spirosoma linguale DSM 74]
MRNTRLLFQSFRLDRLVVALLISALCRSNTVEAQTLKQVQVPKTPLTLAAQGSFYVGGETVEQTQAQLGSFVPGGHLSVNQMYVRYMVPQGGKKNTPVVMVHGMALTGKCWETTPDGRMGWDEYFVRKGYPVYMPDQVGRGRSGFNQAIYNDVRVGLKEPKDLPPMWRFSDENAWPNFRFGEKPGVPFPNGQFPIEALDQLAKQGVPDVSMSLPTPSPNYKALLDLASQLKSAVLISHSQSGRFPLEVALIDSAYSADIKALVLVEPGGTVDSYTDRQIKTLTRLPILVVFGDNLRVETGVPGHSWQTAYEAYNRFVDRVNKAGGRAKMMYLPELGIKGNSHMIMQDKNNLQIADLILKWVHANIDGGRTRVSH